MRHPSLSAMLFALCLACGPAHAQEPASDPGPETPQIAPVETFDLSHEARSYRIAIYRLPAADGPTTLPRAYVLDGARLAQPLAGRLRDAFPRWRSSGIIIGLTRTDAAPVGAAAFRDEEAASLRRFIIDTLQPEINRRFGDYAARQILVGEGDAALFVLHMAAESPETFDAYVAHGSQLNRSLPDAVAEGRGAVHMSSVRWMGRPLDRFEALAVRFEDAGREIRVDSMSEEWDDVDGVEALWRWIEPYFIPPPV